MTAEVALAVSGSNLTGDVPFSCALRHADAVTGARSAAGARGDLAQLVAGLCAQAGVAPDAITELRVDVGPGSYTGLRVAVTFVRFLQRFGAVPVLAVDSLALLAARGVAAETDAGARAGTGAAVAPATRFVAVLDARRERVHHQAFHWRDGVLVAAAPAAAEPLAAVLAALRADDRVVVPACLPAALHAELAARAGVRVEAGVVATELFAAGLPFVAAAAADLEPRYLMASYAEG